MSAADDLDAALDAADGGAAAHRWSPRAAHSGMGPPPVDEVSAHRVGGHWHLATHGLGEGWGFELTLRIPAEEAEPLWAVELLTNLAAYVERSGHPFAAGHHVDLRGPMRLDDPGTALTAAAVVPDPGLPEPVGGVEVLQLVGLCADELELCRAWSTDAVVDLLSRGDPLLVTDLRRRSLLADAAIGGEVAARAGADGSELVELRVATLAVAAGRWGRGAVLEVGSGAAAALGPALRRELVGPGASFTVVGDDAEVRFVAGAAPGWRRHDGLLVVELGADDVEAVARLFDGRTGWGRVRQLPQLRVHVVA